MADETRTKAIFIVFCTSCGKSNTVEVDIKAIPTVPAKPIEEAPKPGEKPEVAEKSPAQKEAGKKEVAKVAASG